jgi:hypothetical protein
METPVSQHNFVAESDGMYMVVCHNAVYEVSNQYTGTLPTFDVVSVALTNRRTQYA